MPRPAAFRVLPACGYGLPPVWYLSLIHIYSQTEDPDVHRHLNHQLEPAVLHGNDRHEKQQPRILLRNHGEPESKSQQHRNPRNLTERVARGHNLDRPEAHGKDKEKFVYIIAVIVRQRFHQDIDRKIPVKRRNSHALPITCPKKCLDSIHTVLSAFLLPRYDPILEYTAYTSSITAIFSYPYSVRSSGIW